MVKRKIYELAAALSLVLLCVCPGCMGHRELIRPASVAFIQPGVTTRTEVEENLGRPTWTLEPEKVLAYVWESGDPYPRYPQYYYAEHPSAYPRPEYDRNLAHHTWSFCVAFDDAGRATGHAFLDAPDSDKLHEEISRWLKAPAK